MAVLVRFVPRGMTGEQYDNVGRRLEEAGKWPPEGLLAHVCFDGGDGLRVSEVWESREQQERFAESLMPALQEEGVDFAAQPEYLAVQGYLFREASSDSGD